MPFTSLRDSLDVHCFVTFGALAVAEGASSPLVLDYREERKKMLSLKCSDSKIELIMGGKGANYVKIA